MDRDVVTGASQTRNVLTWMEFVATLKGPSKLLGAAMRLTHINKKMSREEWDTEFKNFGNIKA